MTMNSEQRYRKQTLFAPIGEEGQAKLARGRAGVGFVRIVDRDFVEISNLQRQVLFDEQDVAERLPKAVAASRKLAAINSGVQVDAVVADVRADNVLELVNGIDV